MPLTLDVTFASFAAGVKAVVASVWADCVPNAHGIWRSAQIQPSDLGNRLLPYAVLELNDYPDAGPEWGRQFVGSELEVLFWRVDQRADDGTALEAKLWKLVNAFLQGSGVTLPVGQVISVGAKPVVYSDLSAANKLFITKKANVLAGSAGVRFIVGEV